MKNQKTSVVINSSTPFIKQYDVDHISKIGKLFDDFQKNGFSIEISGPNENQLMFADEEPFSIEKDLSTHLEGSASYNSVPITASTIIGAVEKFIQWLLDETQRKGKLICKSHEGEKKYRVMVTDDVMELVPL